MTTSKPPVAQSLSPPAGDARRHAIGPVRGFDYQLWQTVDLWAALGPDEALFLEAAEDVDRVSGANVEAGQVKALVRPITLRSAAVRDVVRNYWVLRDQNPDGGVSLALLTTAPRAVEAGQPFGDTTGLDEWDRCRSDLADVGPLRAFLTTLDLGPDVAAFLMSASDAEVRERLVRPVRWATAQPDRRGLRERVEKRVVLHGDRLGLSPSQSRPAVDALYARAWDVVVSDPPRRLDRADFLVAFETATAVLTARSVLAPPAATGALAARAGHVLDPDVAPLVRAPVPRRDLVRLVRERLASTPALALTGSSGMGKSTLAALVAAAGGQWVRLDLRGRGEPEVADLLDLAATAIADLDEGTSVVVDDLLRSTTGRTERPLVALAQATADRGGRLLATGHDPFPSSALAALGVTDDLAHFEVPPLAAGELRRLCFAYGCPAPRADRWGRVIEIQTSGHPQLAAAHARSAAERGWGSVSDDDLFGSPPPLERVKQEARRRLVAGLSDLGAADLAVRLSLYLTPFTRTQALRFAAAEPPISGAGRALDVLTGPWIERVDDEHFRVSPLLAKSHRHHVPPEDETRLHADAARSFLEPTLHPRALNGLLMHGLRGECEEALIAAFTSVHSVEEDTFDRLASWISWFAYASTDGDRPLYPPNPSVSLFLRNLQVQVAVATAGEDVVARVLRAAVREAEAAGDVGVPFMSESLRFMFASQALTHLEAPEHVGFVIEQAATAAKIAGDGVLVKIEAMAAEHGLARAEIDPELGVESIADLVGPLLSILAVRTRSAQALVLLLDTVDRDPHLARALRPLFQDDFPSSIAMTDGAWLDLFRAEKRGEEVDFAPAVEVLRRAVAYADAAGLAALATAARRSLATVLFEHAKEKAAAVAVLKSSPVPRVELYEYQARMLFMEGEAEAALDLYREILPTWKSGPGRANTARAYAYQDALRAAGDAGRMDDALDLAEQAIAVAEEELKRVESPLPLGFRADRAYVLYGLQRYSEAVSAYADVLTRLDVAPAQKGFGVLRGRVGHTLVILESELSRRPIPEGYGPPFVGLFSKPEPDHADYEAPAFPVLIWGRLAHIESLVTQDRTVSNHFLVLSAGADLPLVAHDRAQHRASLAILDASPDLLDLYHQSFRQSALGAGVSPDHVRPFHLDLAQSALGFAVVHAAAHQRLAMLPVQTWVDRALALLSGDLTSTLTVRAWRETVHLALELDAGGRRSAPLLYQRMIGGAHDIAIRVTAAAVLAVHSIDPDVRFYAKTTILQFVEPRAFSEHLAPAVAKLVTGNPLDGYAGAAQHLLNTQSRVSVSDGVRSYLARLESGFPVET